MRTKDSVENMSVHNRSCVRKGTSDPVGIEETCPFGRNADCINVHVWVVYPWQLPKVSVNAGKLMETRSPYVRPRLYIYINNVLIEWLKLVEH
jgi:hypothetical protein